MHPLSSPNCHRQASVYKHHDIAVELADEGGLANFETQTQQHAQQSVVTPQRRTVIDPFFGDEVKQSNKTGTTSPRPVESAPTP